MDELPIQSGDDVVRVRQRVRVVAADSGLSLVDQTKVVTAASELARNALVHGGGGLALGLLAHKAVLRAKGLKASHGAFRHGAIHELPDGLLLADSYHVSRLNTNTGRLTEAMFHDAVGGLVARIGT